MAKKTNAITWTTSGERVGISDVTGREYTARRSGRQYVLYCGTEDGGIRASDPTTLAECKRLAEIDDADVAEHRRQAEAERAEAAKRAAEAAKRDTAPLADISDLLPPMTAPVDAPYVMLPTDDDATLDLSPEALATVAYDPAAALAAIDEVRADAVPDDDASDAFGPCPADAVASAAVPTDRPETLGLDAGPAADATLAYDDGLDATYTLGEQLDRCPRSIPREALARLTDDERDYLDRLTWGAVDVLARIREVVTEATVRAAMVYDRIPRH